MNRFGNLVKREKRERGKIGENVRHGGETVGKTGGKSQITKKLKEYFSSKPFKMIQFDKALITARRVFL